MSTPTDPRLAHTWTSETIRRFVNVAKDGEATALMESFKRQADFMRRYGDDGRAKFWDALANAIAAAVS